MDERWQRKSVVVGDDEGSGNSLTQMSSPFGLAVDQLDIVYVTDGGNHRVMH
jgi:hypothetical protein